MTTPEKIILAVLVIFAVLMWLMPIVAATYIEQQERKKRGEPDESKALYDERQRLIRLEAGTHTLYALGGYLMVWMVLELADALLWEDRTVTLLLGGVLLAVVVWSGECILRGAMLGFNQRKAETGQIIMYFALGASNILQGSIKLDVSVSLGVLAILLGISFMILGGLMLYARHGRRLAENRLNTEDGET